MKILLIIEENFPVDNNKLVELLQQKTKFIEFELYKNVFTLPLESLGLITKPKTFTDTLTQLKDLNKDGYDRIFCFTLKQYRNNYFFQGYENLRIFSFYGWNYLTGLPLSNGILYFIIDCLALKIDQSDFRHAEITGCMYDFLGDKTGVDAGMRQSRFCPNCLKRISDSLTNEDDFKLFDDLQILMNHLSEASKWNKDILTVETPKSKPKSNAKRKSKDTGVIKIAIASPSDANIERTFLLETLAIRFDKNKHEEHCGFRIRVNGWEDLAAQPGYPQDVINNRLIAESDFVIAILRHKLGTPTKDPITGKKRAESGTAEEILQTLDVANKDCPIGMVYFSPAPSISLNNPDRKSILKEWNRLEKFKEKIKDKLLYKPYTDNNDLISTILIDLEKNIMDYFIK